MPSTYPGDCVCALHRDCPWREDALIRRVKWRPSLYSSSTGTTRQLPKLACRTCHNKFHAACLYKWFSSSQKSTCPLCQTTF